MPVFKDMFTRRDGTAAVEFAIIAPLFLLVVFTILSYGIYLSTANTVEQLTSDAARTAVAGLNAKERQELASEYIETMTSKHSYLDKKKLQVTVLDDPINKNQFTVTLRYDASGLPIWTLFAFALPKPEINRYATIRIGGI